MISFVPRPSALCLGLRSKQVYWSKDEIFSPLNQSTEAFAQKHLIVDICKEIYHRFLIIPAHLPARHFLRLSCTIRH